MKNNYDIHVNPPKLSGDDIKKHQNFDALFAQFEQTAGSNPPATETVTKTATLRTNYALWGTIAAAASVALFVTIRTVLSTTTQPTLNLPEPIALQAPLPNIEKPFATYTINSEQGDTLEFSSGSQVIVPASAFIDQKGNPVKGRVDIKYREMQDHVDMFLAGVPQKMGKHTTIQSAGMVQIQGYQDGHPVYIQENKNLQVELRSEVAAQVKVEDLKVYAYNAKTDEWAYKTPDAVEVIHNLPNKTGNSIDHTNPEDKEAVALAKIRAGYPTLTEPVKLTSKVDNRNIFDIDFVPEEFPEFSSYKNLKWAIVDGQNVKDEDIEREWPSVDIKRKGEHSYEVILKDNARELKISVVPVAENPRDAERLYQQELVAYQKAKKEQDAKIETDFAAWKAKNANNTNPIVQADTAAQGDKIIVNRFNIDQFGLWSCANTLPNDAQQNTQAVFVDKDGYAIAVQQIFVATPQQNLYFYTEGNADAKAGTTIQYNPNLSNVVWALTNKNELMVATTKPVLQNKNYIFSLQTPSNINTESDIRQELKKDIVM